MADHLQLTVDGRETPVLAPQPDAVSYEQPRMFDHAPSMRGQLAMSTDQGGSMPDHYACRTAGCEAARYTQTSDEPGHCSLCLQDLAPVPAPAPETLATDPADWPRCTFCQERAAEVLRTTEADEGFGTLSMDACRACEQDQDAWDEPGAEILSSASEQR